MPEVIAAPSCRFSPDREAGLEKLKQFIPHAGASYRERRNYDLGPEAHDSVSQLSPYIRNRLISEEEVCRAALQQHSFAACEKFAQEVFWRTYWKGYLELRPALWTNYRNDLEPLLPDFATNENYQRAIEGKTSIACFDAWAKELCETGYLHNHARMWFASIWIFTLELPWQLGADFFLRHLYDGDPASNTLSWRWVAGLHTAGKTYLATASNIARFTEGRFNPVGELASQADPVSESHAKPEPRELSLPSLPQELPEKTGLILLEEDLCDSLLPMDRFKSVLGLYPKSEYKSARISPGVSAFREQALRSRLDLHSGSFADEELAAAATKWAREQDLEAVAFSLPHVGLWDAAWPAIASALEDAGLRLIPFRHHWERELYPHATAGFFKLKKRLPKLADTIASRAS